MILSIEVVRSARSQSLLAIALAILSAVSWVTDQFPYLGLSLGISINIPPFSRDRHNDDGRLDTKARLRYAIKRYDMPICGVRKRKVN